MAQRLGHNGKDKIAFEADTRVVREQVIDIPLNALDINNDVDVVRVVLHPQHGRSRQVIFRFDDIVVKPVDDWR